MMMYQFYQAWDDMTAPMRAMAGQTALSLGHRTEFGGAWLNGFAAGCELVARMRLTHERPPFGISSIHVGTEAVDVHEESVYTTPFCTLLHFRKEFSRPQPRILLVAPLSGHFSTLLRDTVRTLLPDHDVFITDWHNARHVSLLHGPFRLDDFIAYVMRFLEVIGPGAHALAVCQPGPAALAAVALMSESDNPATPRSLTIMAAPIDTRINPTIVNDLATSHPIEWFENNLVSFVPFPFAGAFRLVYPGFMQLAAFISMNMQRHVKAHIDLVGHRVSGRHTRAQDIASFYDEYCAVMDLPAEFYLETVRAIFQEHALACGELKWRGRRVDPGAIRNTSLLTVEGERDDVCSVGQTAASHDLCPNVPRARKHHHVQAGAGHYGVFSGSRWRQHVYPLVRKHIAANN
jgi:poly(3-hydroxybutyrate) depolymerase